MFHELLEVDNTITVNVSSHCDCDDLLLGQIDAWALREAPSILGEVKGAIHVTVVLLKSSEELHGVKGLDSWMLHLLLAVLLLMDLVNLLFLAHLVKLEVGVDELSAYLGKLPVWDLTVAIAV